MAKKTIILTDVAAGVWTDSFELRESAEFRFAGAHHWSITKRTLRGGLSDGIDVVELNNGVLALSILPTRGMGIWRGRCRGIEVGWNSPVRQPVHPGFVHPSEHNGLGWLTGFNELLCRCGLSSNGVPGLDLVSDNTGRKTETPLTLHGRIANTPAHRVEVQVDTDGEGRMAVSGLVDETSMFGPALRLKTTCETVPGSNRISIHDEVVNMAGGTLEMQLLYHTNFGPPILGAGTRLVVALREVAPRDARAAQDTATWRTYLGPTPGYTEQCYFAELIGDERERTTVLLRNEAGNRGASLEFDIRELPCFTVWKCTQAEADGYVTGLEPATNFPNLKTFERSRGRVPTLRPGQSHTAHIDLTVHESAAEVAAVEQRIVSLQNRAHPIEHARPIARFSPEGS
jgi:hypothetical protein